jgi:transposase
VAPESQSVLHSRRAGAGPALRCTASCAEEALRPRKITDEQVEEVIVKTLESAPPDGGTHWSTRQMAGAVGLNQTAVSRIWRAFGLQPHRVEHWKLSKDPLFVEKVRDIVGLYLDPPERALVLCVDEKSQIQALDRSAPMLPGTPARATHKAPAIKRWLAAHPRFHLHFTPTGASWLNLVERWFGELTARKLKRGVHRSVKQLNADIHDWTNNWNENPKPYVWTKTADQILDNLASYRTAINAQDTSWGGSSFCY